MTEGQDVARTSDLEDFAEALKLLRFLLKERIADYISDQTIDDIEDARERLEGGARLSREERVRLLKAYRDLVTTPRFSVTYDGVPPVRFWSADSWWLRLLFFVSVVPSIGLIILLVVKQSPWPWHWALIYSLIYLLLSMLLVWGLYAFTGVATDDKLNQMIRLCYVFTGLILVGSVGPFFYPGFFLTKQDAPLAVIQGCAREIPGSHGSVPAEVKCDGDVYQWVLKIGGTVSEASDGPPASKPAASPTAETAGAPTGEKPAPTLEAKPGTAAPGTAASSKSATGKAIAGGLVVPLYVIVLALIGSAVSMTRRVPEYQRRAMDSQDPFTNVQARESLVFQMMQVVSAPLIAVTAYYTLKPLTSDATASAALAFGSGFASEPILLMIRGMVDKLSPAREAVPSPVTVRVTPSAATLSPRQPQQFSAKVSGSPNSDVTWLVDPVDGGTISQSGYYVAPDMPPTKPVTITARSTADPTKSGSASIKFEQDPSITGISQKSLPGGSASAQLAIDGDNLGDTRDVRIKYQNRYIAGVIIGKSASQVKFQLTIPADAPQGQWDVVVTDNRNRQASLIAGLAIGPAATTTNTDQPAPKSSRLSPRTGVRDVAQEYTIEGSDLDAVTKVDAVSTGRDVKSAKIVSKVPTEIKCELTLSTGDWTIRMTSGTGTIDVDEIMITDA